MKQRLKQITKFIAICALVTLSSCEKDLYDDKIYQSKINVEKISLKNNVKKSKINGNLFKVISSLKLKEKGLFGRIVYDSINQIYFDDENGIKITKDDYESYTFKIIKESGKLENILFIKNDNNNFDAFKVKYDYTEEEIAYLTEEQFANSLKIFSELIVDDSGQLQVLSKCIAVIDCIIVPSPRDDGDPEGPNAIEICTYHLEGCDGGGGTGVGSGTGIGTEAGTGTGTGTGTGAGTGSNTGPSGGGGGIGTTPVITTPIPCLLCPPSTETIITNDPCGKIKSLLASFPQLNDDLPMLQFRTGETIEHGLYKVTNANVIQNPGVNSYGEVSFLLPTGSGKYSFMGHTHNSPAVSTYSVPSWTDLEGLATIMMRDKVDEGQFVYFLFTADGTNYAFTVENPTAFKTFFATINDSTYFNPQIATQKSTVMRDYYNLNNDPSVTPLISENSTSTLQDKKHFLEMLQDNNLGITLLESTDLINYTQLSYDKATNQVIPTPCP